MALGSCGVPPFEIRVDGSVFCRYQHPAWFASPRSRGDNRFEIVSCIEHLRSRHESGLLRRQVGCEVLMKLRRVEVSETICRLRYRIRLAEVAWEALSDVSFILSSIRHVPKSLRFHEKTRVIRITTRLSELLRTPFSSGRAGGQFGEVL